MTLPLLIRQADTLRYDPAGVVRMLDRRHYPDETRFLECVDLESVVRAIALLDAQGGSPGACAAGYGLAVVARAWREQPSDARRGALIQAAAVLREAQPHDAAAERVVAQALARADAAILAGADAEAAIVQAVDAQVRRADKAAERCGRLAAELLDDGDRVLVHGFPGAALGWMLSSAYVEQGKQIQLSTTEARPDLQGGRLAAHLAQAIGVPLASPGAAAIDEGFAQGLFAVYIAAALRIALDGSVAGVAGTARYAALARRHGIPCYILGYDALDQAAATGADLAPALDITPPALISAIITIRGVYRPEMIARYQSGGDAPLDVIPLT